MTEPMPSRGTPYTQAPSAMSYAVIMMTLLAVIFAVTGMVMTPGPYDCRSCGECDWWVYPDSTGKTFFCAKCGVVVVRPDWVKFKRIGRLVFYE